jgi:peptidoglycan hydrolase-like protein with peptidoglycan-binding domain
MINRLEGTITWLPGVGDVIRRGDRAFTVDGKPVILMYGKVPAYRELADGVSDGPDVKQLESNLAALGFDDGGAMSVDNSFTSTTAAAVSDWQDSVGLPQTGSVELGRVVFAPGPRRVDSLDVALGSDAGGSAGGGGDGSAASSLYDEPSVPITLASVKTPSGSNGPNNSGSNNGSGSDSGNGSGDGSGSSSTASTDVLTTTSLRRAVTVDLDANQLSLAKRGRPARINLPGGSSAKGRITSVGTTASSSDSGSGSGSSSSTVGVTISMRGRAGGLDQAPVTVDLIDQLRRNVLAVPVSALVGTAGGHYAIVVHQGTERRQIPVQPGLFADSYVEVSGPGLSEGMRVEVPQF